MVSIPRKKENENPEIVVIVGGGNESKVGLTVGTVLALSDMSFHQKRNF